MPGSCFINTVRSIVGVGSPSTQSNLSKINTGLKHELSGNLQGVQTSSDADADADADANVDAKSANGRKILIVVESSIEAKNALHWALTHTLHTQDLLFLLYVAKPSKQGLKDERITKKSHATQRVPDFLPSMKNMCELKRPEVKTEIIVAEGKEKGPTVVEEAKTKEVDMLILGMKKRSISWRILMMWAGNRQIGRDRVVEYCIQNASCIVIAVRKHKNGGYLITTKHHKKYWLLA